MMRGMLEVGLARRRRADADVVVGEAHVQRLAIGLRVHGDRLDAELAARADDAQRDLAAIRDQDFLEHVGFTTLRSRLRAGARSSRASGHVTLRIRPS